MRIALETEKRSVLKAICPDQGTFNTIYRLYRRKGNTSWLFSETAYKEWAHANTSSLLWLQGKLGSGKTVVMASAAANLVLEQGER